MVKVKVICQSSALESSYCTTNVYVIGALKLRDLTSQDLTTRHQIKQIETGWTSVGPRKNRTCWTISELKSCLSRFDSGAYSRLQFLCAVNHSVGAHTESLHPRVDNSSSSKSSEDEDKDRQAPVPAATTSGASESATAAVTTNSDNCCEVCIVAPQCTGRRSDYK